MSKVFMIKELFYRTMAGFHRERGLRQLRLLEQKLVTSQARFAVPFTYRGKGYFKTIEPRQNPTEIEELYRTICKLRPKRVLEIGTARGGTLYLWTQAATADAVIVSVDLPEGEFGGAYPTCRVPFYQAFKRPEQKLHLLRKDSHQANTVEEVIGLFNKDPIDFAFIDGDHTYEGVKADFLNYGPFVRPWGLIGFHDILPRPDLPAIQVDRFWKEVKKKYHTKEIIGPDESGRKIGIGLIRMGTFGIKL
ncbi:MAG: class I SAM-dependent methyltransferase [Spirochaetes bacterium]|nr:class I SAM-dependent methyltransferase [Spirochaetota bacterium]